MLVQLIVQTFSDGMSQCQIGYAMSSRHAALWWTCREEAVGKGFGAG